MTPAQFGNADPTTQLTVPAAFAAGIVAQEGDSGRRWLDGLPHLIANLCRDWRLMSDGAPMHGHLGLVLPVRRGDEPLALKVSLIEPTTIHERTALIAWHGHGAVRLLDARPDDGALLLERLDASRSLAGLPLDEAIPIAAGIVRRLAIPAPPGVPRQSDIAHGLAATLPARWAKLGQPFPAYLMQRAVDLARNLAEPARACLVNYDLHDDNILAGEREPWLVIDPKAIAGDPEFGVAQYFWRRADEIRGPDELRHHLDTFVTIPGLDPERAHQWMLVRLVDYWLWALSIGLTEDPRRCATLIDWLRDELADVPSPCCNPTGSPYSSG